MSAMSEPEPRRSASAAAAGAGSRGAAGHADHHLLALLHVAAEHLGRAAVTEAKRHGHRPGLAVGIHHEDATQSPAALPSAGELLVARLLLGCEDLADAPARLLADALAFRLALGIAQTCPAQ